ASTIVASLVLAVFFMKNTLRTEMVLLASPSAHREQDKVFWYPRLVQLVKDSLTSDTTGLIATLDPLLPLAVHRPYYPALLGGWFAYPVGDALSADQRARYRIASPSTIIDLLEKTPPSAIIVGAYNDVLYGHGSEEEPLLN